jgi:hypothetical protein
MKTEIEISYRIACKDKDKTYYYSEHDKDWYSELSYSTCYETYTEAVEVAIIKELETQEDWFIVKCKTTIETPNDPVLVKFFYIEKGVVKIAVGKFEEADEAFIEDVYGDIINSGKDREGKGWFYTDKEGLKEYWHKIAEIEDYTN